VRLVPKQLLPRASHIEPPIEFADPNFVPSGEAIELPFDSGWRAFFRAKIDFAKQLQFSDTIPGWTHT